LCHFKFLTMIYTIVGAGAVAHCVVWQNRITAWGVSDGSITVFRQLLITNFFVNYLRSKMQLSNMIAWNIDNLLNVKDITISPYFDSYVPYFDIYLCM
jgi:hypothetical protein